VKEGKLAAETVDKRHLNANASIAYIVAEAEVRVA
jgi:hypothetical protein